MIYCIGYVPREKIRRLRWRTERKRGIINRETKQKKTHYFYFCRLFNEIIFVIIMETRRFLRERLSGFVVSHTGRKKRRQVCNDGRQSVRVRAAWNGGSVRVGTNKRSRSRAYGVRLREKRRERRTDNRPATKNDWRPIAATVTLVVPRCWRDGRVGFLTKCNIIIIVNTVNDTWRRRNAVTKREWEKEKI